MTVRILKISLFLALLWLIAGTFSVFEAHAREADESQTLQVVGTGIIRNDDLTAARDAAVSNSLTAAARRVIMDVLPSETLAARFGQVLALLQTSASDFVRDYRILAENRHQDTYQVLVTTTLSVAAIQKELEQQGLWGNEIQPPEILLLTAEKKLSDLYPQYWWEDVNPETPFPTYEQISRALTGEGFRVLDRATIQQNQELSQLRMMPQISPEEAVRVARQIGADAVLLSSAGVRHPAATMETDGTDMLSASLKARLLLTQTGEEVTRIEETSEISRTPSDSDGFEALAKVADTAALKLSEPLQQAWEKANTRVRQIEIKAGGSAYSIGNFIALRRMLNAIDETENIQTRRIQSHNASIMIDFRGDSHGLAQALLKQTNDQFAVDIGEKADHYLIIELVSNTSN